MFTKKKFLIISLSMIVLIPIVVVYILNNGNPYEEYIVNKNVPAHLEKMGYTDEDIIKQSYVQPKHTINSDFYHGHYMVVFKDEPHLEYLYGVTKEEKKVVQFCEKETLIDENMYGEMTTEKTIHSESECMGYLENRR